MGLFNNRELLDLRLELDRIKTSLEKAEADLKVATGRAVAAEETLLATDRTVETLNKENKDLKVQVERLLECRVRAEKAASFFEERFNAVRRELDFAKGAVESSRVGEGSRAAAAHLKGENSRLKVELELFAAQVERLKVQLEQAKSEIPTAGHNAGKSGQHDGDDLAAMRSELDSTRRRLAESEEMRRLAVRKAEHNRRAWATTQMQLDLAEDRLCLITTGKPRPVIDDSRYVTSEGNEMIQADDVDAGNEIVETVTVQTEIVE